MDPYSPLLLAALVATGLAALVPWHRRTARFRRPLAACGAVLAALAGGFHLALGHAPGSDAGLGVAAFLAEHRAWVFVLIAAVVLAFWPGRDAGRAGRKYR